LGVDNAAHLLCPMTSFAQHCYTQSTFYRRWRFLSKMCNFRSVCKVNPKHRDDLRTQACVIVPQRLFAIFLESPQWLESYKAIYRPGNIAGYMYQHPGPWGDVYSDEITINSITLRETCLINYKRIKPCISRERYIDFAIKKLVAMLPAIIARSVHTLRWVIFN
jgi:hypothetical protein